jgi:hypothetical protein
MLVSPLAGLIDPGAIGSERDAGHVVHGGKIVGQSYLLGIGDLADSVHQVQHVKIAASLLQQPGLHRPEMQHADQCHQIGERFMKCQKRHAIWSG